MVCLQYELGLGLTRRRVYRSQSFVFIIQLHVLTMHPSKLCIYHYKSFVVFLIQDFKLVYIIY